MPSICSKYASVPDTYTEGTHQFVTNTLRVYASVPDAYAQHVLKGPYQISYVHSVYALVLDAYAQCTNLSDAYA